MRKSWAARFPAGFHERRGCVHTRAHNARAPCDPTIGSNQLHLARVFHIVVKLHGKRTSACHAAFRVASPAIASLRVSLVPDAACSTTGQVAGADRVPQSSARLANAGAPAIACHRFFPVGPTTRILSRLREGYAARGGPANCMAFPYGSPQGPSPQCPPATVGSMAMHPMAHCYVMLLRR